MCVELNSGSPPMTIKGIGGQGEYHTKLDVVACTWFDGTKLKEAYFVPEVVTPAKRITR